MSLKPWQTIVQYHSGSVDYGGIEMHSTGVKMVFQFISEGRTGRRPHLAAGDDAQR